MKVIILLSAYNGSKYIEEQIDSLINQENVDVQIFIRDDGSTDNTLSILEKYKSNDYVTIIKGRNIGCANSFLELMKAAYSTNKSYDYVAFCDQDDYWMPGKLSKAVSSLMCMDNNIPCLYFSNLYVVDSHLNNPSLLFSKDEVNLSKRHSLIESFCTGCTMVFNKKALELYLKTPIRNLRIHDKRMFHMCLFLGQIHYDCDAFIKYRQHGNNVIGADTYFIQRLRNRMKSIRSLHTQHVREEDAKEILYSFENLLASEDINIIKEVAFYRNNFLNRIKLLFNKDYKIANFVDNFWSKIRVLIGHL